MTVFVDTSAFYALIDADDRDHPAARQVWVTLLNESANLICSSYVILETISLLQNRIGLAAVQTFQQDILPVLNVEWVSQEAHRNGISALLAVARKSLSLVDCVSFNLMRRSAIRHAFAIDEHFLEQGFQVMPEKSGQER